MDTIATVKPNESARFNKKLGVVTHVPHWTGPDGAAWAYEPYVREMRVWAELFSHVEICAPVAEGPMRGNQAPYDRANIIWRPVSYCWSVSRRSQLKRAFQMPGLVQSVNRIIRRSDLVHLRSPGHPGLIGNLLVRLMYRRSITKWAGFFGPYEGERLPSRIDRWLLILSGARHPVLIYGPSERSHLLSFLPALMSTEELAQSRQLSSGRCPPPVWMFLSVGRLEPEKGFDLAIRGLGELRRLRPELDWKYTLIGDGPAADGLREQAMQSGIADRMLFTGALPFNEVQKHYAEAHVAIMPGIVEGWPKIIAEAWAHGAIPVAASAGIVPWILQDKDVGVQFQPTPAGLAKALAELLDDPERIKIMSEKLMPRAEELSLESFKSRLEHVLIEHCGMV
ncbi:MAG: glycosyltransferase family 4 protein [Pyrinomonadaceae bacterium]|nr:glycosyltransferase family 4 protein [Pyrinomonadaceae bacterium]